MDLTSFDLSFSFGLFISTFNSECFLAALKKRLVSIIYFYSVGELYKN